MSPAPKHSRFGASNRERTRGCPGSVAFIPTVPRAPSSEAAEEGTQAHGVAETYLRNATFVAPAGDVMAEAAQAWRELVLAESKVRGAYQLFVEHRVALKEAHPDCFGTADAIVYYPGTAHLLVWDFKFGKGVEVPAEENPQLLQYGASALWTLAVPVRSARLGIFQPRAPSGETVKTWEVTPERLFDETYTIKAEIDRALAPDAPLIPGSWCRWCPAAAVCPALREESQKMAEQEFALVALDENSNEVLGYDPATLARWLEAVPRIEAACESVRKFAYAEAEAGRPAPGFKLVEKRAGPRRWRSDDPALETKVKALVNACGALDSAAYSAPELKTPPQIEKLFSKEMKKADPLAEMVTRESTGFTLVPDSDPRPAVAPSVSAEEEFPLLENTAVPAEGNLI